MHAQENIFFFLFKPNIYLLNIKPCVILFHPKQFRASYKVERTGT